MTSVRTNPETTGYVFDIQGLSVHDGPGCRTLVFLNGCTLNCFWCSNPEGSFPKPVPAWFESKCIACNDCVVNCQFHAVIPEDKRIRINRDLCLKCDTYGCIAGCYSGALRISGYEMSVARLLEIISRDRQYWGNGGGVTLTGGEPLFQAEFAAEILAGCHKAFVHTAIETCGNIPYESYERAIPYTDWIFFDLKHPGNSEHFNATGSGNERIFANAVKLSREFQGRLIFRVPVIPGFNDSPEQISRFSEFIGKTGRNEVNILPLHHLGREKYKILGKVYKADDYPVPTREYMAGIRSAFLSEGIQCYSGSETPF